MSFAIGAGKCRIQLCGMVKLFHFGFVTGLPEKDEDNPRLFGCYVKISSLPQANQSDSSSCSYETPQYLVATSREELSLNFQAELAHRSIDEVRCDFFVVEGECTDEWRW